jgi:hypothetical protein
LITNKIETILDDKISLINKQYSNNGINGYLSTDNKRKQCKLSEKTKTLLARFDSIFNKILF